MLNVWKYISFILFVQIIYSSAESIDVNNNRDDKQCYPDIYRNSRKACECSSDIFPSTGLGAIKIDCSFKDLKSSDLSQTLPYFTNSLDLSWNVLNEMPTITSDSLLSMNLIHNNITLIKRSHFDGVRQLEQLFLSWNSLYAIQANVFDDLTKLKVLDLSHNNLRVIPSQIFTRLTALTVLNLSWNRDIQSNLTTQFNDMVMNLDIPSSLRDLRMEACNLKNLSLSVNSSSLDEVHLRRNEFIRIPKTLPVSITKLDISENFLKTLTAEDLIWLLDIEELYVEDMPQLNTVEKDAFITLRHLRKLSFQNDRRLSVIDGYAFGVKTSSTAFPKLKQINLRGTTLHTINSTLEPVFQGLTELNLNGVPLNCDCECRWIKGLKIETHGRCFQPSNMRGVLVTEVKNSDFTCGTWPRWAYGLMILVLIVLCSVGIYFIVMCLRPHRAVSMRRKVGSGSPYARVTIETNRPETFTS